MIVKDSPFTSITLSSSLLTTIHIASNSCNELSMAYNLLYQDSLWITLGVLAAHAINAVRPHTFLVPD